MSASLRAIKRPSKAVTRRVELMTVRAGSGRLTFGEDAARALHREFSF